MTTSTPMRLSAAGLAVALTATLAGCGGDDGPAKLRMTIWTANEAHLDLFNEIADEYLADHPDVAEIEFDPLPFEKYTSTLTTQIAGDNAPDLAWILENSAPDFVSSGALLPLTDELSETKGYELDDLEPSTTKLWEREEQLYAYPFSTSPFGVFVNSDLMKEAGQPSAAKLRESKKWTWEEVITAGAAVERETGESGMVIRDFDYTGWDNLSTLWTGWGAQAWSADGKKCGFDSPEMVEAMTFLHESIFEEKAMPGPGTTADFFAGESAMTVTQISRASLLEKAGFEWDLLPLPSGPKGDYSVIGQAGLGVLKLSEHQEQATDFLAFMTNPENSAKLAKYFPPPRASQLTAKTLAKTNPLLSEEQLQSVVIDGIAEGVVKPSHLGENEISETVRSELDSLWTADADVPTVMGQVCEAIGPQLK